MKLTVFILVAFGLHVPAAVFSQSVTLKFKNAPLATVLKSIKQQTRYTFVAKGNLIEKANKVTLDLENIPLMEALKQCFKDQPFKYAIDGNMVIIKAIPAISSNRQQNNTENTIALPPVKITGRVTDADGVALVRASVAVKGSKNSTSTNAEGIFNLAVNVGDILIISYIGYQSTEYKITSAIVGSSDRQTTPGTGMALTISLKQVVKEEEVVVVAYGNSTRRTNVGAITVIKGEDIQSLPVRSIDRALQGLVPGLQITSGNGLPGGGVANITLRGIATGGAGIARNPLFVIDGTPVTQIDYTTFQKSTTATSNISSSTNNNPPSYNPLAHLNPNDIESITVLKDATAISIYGAQASNGVILITTKKGRAGSFRINFCHQTDVSGRLSANRNVLSQNQYLGLLYESYKNADPAVWTDAAILADLKSKFPTKADGDFYPVPDWFDELYSNSAVSLSNVLSFSGGNEKITHFISLGNLNQNGILKNTFFKRSSMRYNLDFRPSQWFNLGINSSFSYTQQESGDPVDDYGSTGSNGFAYNVSPLLPIRQENGNYILYYPYGAGGPDVPNPAAGLEYNYNKINSYQGIGNAFMELRFLKHFSFRTNVGVNFATNKTKAKLDKRVGSPNYPTGSLKEQRDITSELIINNIFNYQQNFKNSHSVRLMLSHEARVSKFDQLFATGSGFTSGFSEDELSSASYTFSRSNNIKSTSLSYFAQANYDFKKKYLISTNVRLDGFSRFGSEVPLKKFWSFGAGWILSEESFLRKVKWFNFLKLRGSIGVAGNTLAIPPSTRSNRVSGLNYSNPTVLLGTSVLLTPGNPEVKPESTLNTDLGIEARFWNERITFSSDIYNRKTRDLVISIDQPRTTGLSSIYTNIGDIENKGIELSLSVDIIRYKYFAWNINGNWSTNSNKLVRAYQPQGFSNSFIYQEGSNYESWYLIRWAGVDPIDGAPQYLDKEGKIFKSYAPDSKVIVGKQQPDGFGTFNTSFRFKGIEFSASCYYAYGYDVQNSWLESMINDGNSQPYSNQSVLALDHWQKPGDIATNPRRVLNSPGNIIPASSTTRFLVRGDHVRLKNIILNYSLSQKLIKSLHLSSANIFVQLNNIGLLWTKSDAIDPDNTGTLGQNGASYPQQKTFSIGFNLNL